MSQESSTDAFTYKIFILVLVLGIIAITGCGEKPVVQDSIISQPDPKSSFESLIDRYIDSLQTLMHDEHAALPPHKQVEKTADLIHMSTISYDVRKTDSLVTPYEGTLSLTYSFKFQVFSGIPMTPMNISYVLIFGFRDGSWEPRSVIKGNGEVIPFDQRRGILYKAYLIAIK